MALTEEEAEQIGFIVGDNADGGCCTSCTVGIIDPLCAAFPEQAEAFKRGANRAFSYDDEPPENLWAEGEA
jgi:hypothetical protein